jgi:hypothetical protein
MNQALLHELIEKVLARKITFPEFPEERISLLREERRVIRDRSGA